MNSRGTEQQTVLLAFKDRSVAAYFSRVLSGEGYRVLAADSLAALVGALERYRVDLLITGERLPGVSVTALLPLLRERYADIKVIVAMRRYSPRLELLLRQHKILYVFPLPVSEGLVRAVVSQGIRAA
jgi:DNA-binding NtrC family response regulator